MAAIWYQLSNQGIQYLCIGYQQGYVENKNSIDNTVLTFGGDKAHEVLHFGYNGIIVRT